MLSSVNKEDPVAYGLCAIKIGLWVWYLRDSLRKASKLLSSKSLLSAVDALFQICKTDGGASSQ